MHALSAETPAAKDSLAAVVQAAQGHAQQPDAFWLRASLPANYTQAAETSGICSGFAKILALLAPVIPASGSAGMQLLRGEATQRACRLLPVVWSQNSLYGEYITRLHSGAGRRYASHAQVQVGPP